MSPRPSVLAVSSELPWPLNTGGHLRTFHVLKALTSTFEVRLVVPMERDEPAIVSELEARGIRIVPARVPPRGGLSEGWRLVDARMRGEPYVLYRRHAREAVFRTWATELQRRPALVHLDHLDGFLFHEAARHANVPALLDLHNVYSLVIERMAAEASNPLKKAFFRGEAARLSSLEARACASGATILAVSRGEADHFRSLGATDVTIAPNGVDCSAFASLPTGRVMDPPVILYLGSLSWGPNASAARHLAEHIFPEILRRRPDARLLLVGKDPSPEIQQLANAPGVTVKGNVPSVQPCLAEASVLAVPLDSGGGTRLKILEGFAAGIPVVSTSVGAEGIDAEPGREIVIAERPEMADAILQLIADPPRAERLAAEARALALKAYDWETISRTIVGCAERASASMPVPA